MDLKKIFNQALSITQEKQQEQAEKLNRFIEENDRPFLEDARKREKLCGTGITIEDTKRGLDWISQETALLKGLRKWEYDNDVGGALIYGPPGHGKSTLMKAFIVSKMDQIETFLFIEMTEFKSLLFDDYATIWPNIERLSKIDLLVMDDIGSENLTANQEAFFRTVLENRIRENKKTFATSNLTPKALYETYDARTINRMLDLMVFTPYVSKCFRSENNIRRQQSFSELVKEDEN